MRARSILEILVIAALLPVHGWAAELTGQVDEVSGSSVRIVVEGSSAAQTGDRVALEGEIAGLGWVAIDGVWSVVEVGDGFVTAELVGDASGHPQLGYRARISVSDEPMQTPEPWDPRIDGELDAVTPWLGIDTFEMGAPGVLVGAVAVDSPAEAAGVRAGDRILDFDGRSVAVEDLGTSVILAAIGEPVSIRVLRGDEVLELDVVLVSEPSEVADVMRARELIEDENYDEARATLRNPAENGHPEARATLAWMKLNGWGGPVDEAEVLRLCTSANGTVSAGCGLVLCELMTRGSSSPAAESGCRRAAGEGVPMAQERLGFALARGAGVVKDPAEAALWLHRAASVGWAAAEIELGLLIERGEGVRKDPAEAFRLYRSAAETGNPVAQYHLGRCYHFGVGAKVDSALAVRWYHESAAAGYPPAQSDLGVMLMLGQGTIKNPEEAADWFERAARVGNVEAQYNLGRVYLFGEGRPEDRVAARQWLETAASRGHQPAAELLAAMR